MFVYIRLQKMPIFNGAECSISYKNSVRFKWNQFIFMWSTKHLKNEILLRKPTWLKIKIELYFFLVQK